MNIPWYNILATIGRILLLISIFFSAIRIVNNDKGSTKKDLKFLARAQMISFIIGIVIIFTIIVLRVKFQLI